MSGPTQSTTPSSGASRRTQQPSGCLGNAAAASLLMRLSVRDTHARACRWNVALWTPCLCCRTRESRACTFGSWPLLRRLGAVLRLYLADLLFLRRPGKRAFIAGVADDQARSATDCDGALTLWTASTAELTSYFLLLPRASAGLSRRTWRRLAARSSWAPGCVCVCLS